jgi:hypothetical protein
MKKLTNLFSKHPEIMEVFGFIIVQLIYKILAKIFTGL